MVQEPLFVTNRMVVVVLPKAPFVEWINRFSRGVAEPVTLEEAREDPNAFLIPVRADELDTPGERRLRQKWSILFERMLEDWYADESLWPRSRTRRMFQEWCELRTHSVVLDCSDEPLEYSDD
jgi:hypothetical protein